MRHVMYACVALLSTIGLLVAANRVRLFPRAYQSVQAFAESDLIYWLSHPNEMGQAPDQMELVEP